MYKYSNATKHPYIVLSGTHPRSSFRYELPSSESPQQTTDRQRRRQHRCFELVPSPITSPTTTTTITTTAHHQSYWHIAAAHHTLYIYYIHIHTRLASIRGRLSIEAHIHRDGHNTCKRKCASLCPRTTFTIYPHLFTHIPNPKAASHTQPEPNCRRRSRTTTTTTTTTTISTISTKHQNQRATRVSRPHRRYTLV